MTTEILAVEINDRSLTAEVRRVVIRRAAKALAFAHKRIDHDQAELVLQRLRLEAKDGRIANVEHLEYRLGYGDDAPGDLLRALLVSKCIAAHEDGGFKVLVGEET